jgi:uncharacterized protein (TIGR00369 family)
MTATAATVATVALAPAPERRHFGLIPRETLARLDGIDVFKAIEAGELPLPPIGRTLGFDPVRIGNGEAVFEGKPGLEHYNPLGIADGGYITTLLDSAMGCAVHSLLKAGQGYATVELKVNFLRPVTAASGMVRAEGKVINLSRSLALAEARLIDGAGKLLAHGTSTCQVFPL